MGGMYNRPPPSLRVSTCDGRGVKAIFYLDVHVSGGAGMYNLIRNQAEEDHCESREHLFHPHELTSLKNAPA